MDSPPTLGVVTLQNGVNFAVHAPGTPLTLKLFHEGNPSSFFSKCMQKTGSVQHLFVKDLSPPFLYAFECSSGKLLLDPYAKEISSSTTLGAVAPLSLEKSLKSTPLIGKE